MNARNFYLSLLVVFITDQVTKKLFFSPEMALNKGVSFAFLSGVPQWLLVIGLMIVLVAVWKWGEKMWLAHQIPAGMFFGAASSNLLDRVLYGGVRDFLPVPFLGIDNNLADYFLTIAVIWLVLVEVSSYRQEPHGN